VEVALSWPAVGGGSDAVEFAVVSLPLGAAAPIALVTSAAAAAFWLANSIRLASLESKFMTVD
jgi:hypothetical protein